MNETQLEIEAKLNALYIKLFDLKTQIDNLTTDYLNLNFEINDLLEKLQVLSDKKREKEAIEYYKNKNTEGV